MFAPSRVPIIRAAPTLDDIRRKPYTDTPHFSHCNAEDPATPEIHFDVLGIFEGPSKYARQT